MASKLSSIDYKKRAKGQSKREYAAQVLGGKLDYKTGSISVPAKKTVKKTSKLSLADAAEDIERAQLRSGVDSSGNTYGDVYDPSSQYYSASAVKEATKNKNISSQRDKASKVYKTNKFADQKINQAKGSSRITSSIWRGLLGAGLTAAKSAVPFVGATTNLANTLGYDLTTLLGIPQYKVSNPSDYAGTNNNPADRLNESFGLGGEPMQDRIENITKNEQDLVRGGFSPDIASIISGSNKIVSNDESDNRRTSSRPVSNPIFQPTQTSSLSDILNGGSPQSAPDFSAGQTTDKTQRRFPGNGLLSKGTFANGKGDYGMEGTFGTNQLSEESNLLNEIFGIPTAQASFIPETQNNFLNSLSTPNNYLNSDIYKDTMSRMYPKNTSNEDITSDYTGGYNQPAIGGSTGGGVAQQYSQQGKNPQQQYYEEAIKNAKKVMNETIKALKKQYKESERTGTDALNKQKAEDLQALSARFSFGLNQDPNSEQAIQYSQRMQNDYAGKLADFLKQLSTAKNQDISSAKKDYYSQKDQAQAKLAELMAQLQQAQIKSQTRGTTSSGKKKEAAYWAPDGSYTFNEKDPDTGLTIFYDPQTNEPFINQ